MKLDQYINTVNTRYKLGISSEHSYRADLEWLIRELVPAVEITNDPLKLTDCGNPDYVITKGVIPIGFIEAKDVGKDLNSSQYKEQFTRYIKALDNLIITDYLWFLYFQNGKLVADIKIGEINIDGSAVRPLNKNFEEFANLIQNFCTFISQTIKSPKKLAKLMASKARLLENILEKAIISDEKTEDNSSLRQQYKIFKNILIHDLTPKEFSDIYAQTLAYGMFSARLHDRTLDTFSRQEAAELIPKTNPFLRNLFSHVAGIDIDERIRTTVDNLAEVFRATNVEELFKGLGKTTQANDPIIHFYETFLAEYDSKLRKVRGVWYTPEPIVKFLVRSVDKILKEDFGLSDGIASTEKTKIEVEVKGALTKKGNKIFHKKEVHKVQILDPATGTGTFISETIKQIYREKFTSIQGIWSSYVENDLIPRLNGFEILMASYSMAHLKLDLLLNDTGYKPIKSKRFNIFLTNSLEEHHPDTGTLFSSWLSTEANESNRIKKETPVMVVIGNPPYSVSSSNNGDWIKTLIQDYKKNLNERNIQPLSDDYIKFIRYGQFLIDKTGEGILAYISNNSFIEGNIHREMRKNLTETFDKLYILDLHGSSNKKETAPDGSKDENVFDIRQGVSISLFIKKKGSKKKKADVYHAYIYGKRDYKYDYLNSNELSTINWNKIKITEPDYFFVKSDYKKYDTYKKNIPVDKLFNVNSTGIKSHRDGLVIGFNDKALSKVIEYFLSKENSDEKVKSSLGLKDNRDWSISDARRNNDFDDNLIKDIVYRPFDNRRIYFDDRLIDFPRSRVMQHMFNNNFAIIIPKQISEKESAGALITNALAIHKSFSAYNTNYYFPLYIYEINNDLHDEEVKTHNFNLKIIYEIEQLLNMTFSEEKSSVNTFSALNLLDYIYAILHSNKYKLKYGEFLKTDFPRIPFNISYEIFWLLVGFGDKLRNIHLLNSNLYDNRLPGYTNSGDNRITNKISKQDWTENSGFVKVWINNEQFFDRIPSDVWDVFTGGFQPAQKWLKDRHGETLFSEDILHYQKIIASLTLTKEIIGDIDSIDI